MKQGLNQQLSQQQRLSQQMVQAISLLSISTNELSELIYNEVEKNPALEIVKNSSIENAGIRLKTSNFELKKKTTDADVYQSFLESSPSQTETLREHLLQQLNISTLTEEEKSIAEKIIFSLDERGYFAVPLEELFSENIVEKSVEKLVDNPVHNSVENFSPLLITDSSVDKKVKAFPL